MDQALAGDAGQGGGGDECLVQHSFRVHAREPAHAAEKASQNHGPVADVLANILT